jgi:DNA repair exonuclease SbcCD ATPase subunit
MKSKYINLNVTLTIIIILVVFYIYHLTIYDNNKVKEGNIGRKIRKTVNKVIKPVKKTLISQINKVEKKLNNTVKKSIKPIETQINQVEEKLKKTVKKTTKPLIVKIESITTKLNSVIQKVSSLSNIVTNVINGLKNGIVTPLLNVFKYISLMFSELGLIVFDFLSQIAQAPSCLISYIVWIITTLKEQIILKIILPSFKKIFKTILGRFYPSTVIELFIKFLNWYINVHFYILSFIGSLLGINNVFYKDKCFNFSSNFKKRINNIKEHLKNSNESFLKFGNFNF